MRVALKEMLAALEFHRYHHWETHVLNDEDRVLGVEPAGQRVFLGALQSAPAAFAADYGEESARSSDQIAERFRREVIFGAFVDGGLCVQSQHSCSKPPQSGGTSE
jgi:hypothetical protein